MPEEMFDNLPDEEIVEELTPEEKQKKEEEIRKLTIANRIEDKKIQKLKEDLSRKRQEEKKLKQEESPEEEEDIEEEKVEKPVVSEDVISQTVEKTLQKRDEETRRKQMIEQIKSVAKTKQEAERILEEASKFPGDWEIEDRVSFARERIKTLREKTRGFQSPSASGGVFDDLDSSPSEEEVPGMSKERIKVLKNLGWTVEEIKKFKDGPDLGRVWGEGKVFSNNR